MVTVVVWVTLPTLARRFGMDNRRFGWLLRACGIKPRRKDSGRLVCLNEIEKAVGLTGSYRKVPGGYRVEQAMVDALKNLAVKRNGVT